MRPLGGRSAAASVLLRVWTDDAFAGAVLEAELERSVQLDPRERGFATELVYGTLRVEPWLTQQIEQFATKGLKKLDPNVRVHMLLAAYQLYFLRVPAFAAVHEAVDEISRLRGGNLAPFANAVLRKVAAAAASVADVPAVRKEATLASVPSWLRGMLSKSLGKEPSREFILASADVPPQGIRVLDATQRDSWRERLGAETTEAEWKNGSASPHALLVQGAGRLQRLPGWAEGEWTIQEEGSQVVGLALGAAPGESLLDACAGRGNKTSLLASAVGSEGSVDAADLYEAKLDQLEIELARQGQRVRNRFAVDWSVGTGDAAPSYDGILLDAPCSGIGTLRRRPDILLRRTHGNIAELAALQTILLGRMSELIRPGGRLVYAVCSVLREEAEDVLARVLESRPYLEPAPFASAVARELSGGSTSFRLLPHMHGTDGYFLASLRRRPL